MQRRDPLTHHISDYPEVWVQRHIMPGGFVDDSMLQACLKAPCGFMWSEIGDYLIMTQLQRSILAAAHGCGLRQGFTVPANLPFEPPGSCSFASRRSAPLPPWRQQAAQLVGAHAMKNVRRTAGWTRFPRALISFGPREQEVLDWMAEGKSYTDLATILNMRHGEDACQVDPAQARRGAG